MHTHAHTYARTPHRYGGEPRGEFAMKNRQQKHEQNGLK